MGIVLNADQIGEEKEYTRISRHRKKKVHILKFSVKFSLEYLDKIKKTRIVYE